MRWVQIKNHIIKRGEIQMVNFKEDEKLNKLNHSCAHMMAQAVKHLYPDAKFWVGPVIDSGFYYGKSFTIILLLTP